MGFVEQIKVTATIIEQPDILLAYKLLGNLIEFMWPIWTAPEPEYLQPSPQIDILSKT